MSIFGLTLNTSLELILTFIGVGSSILSIGFFLATYGLTNKYGVRFQRRLDRRDFADAILEGRIADIEDFLCLKMNFCPRKKIDSSALPPEDSGDLML